ncbi:ribonuclease T2 family protein [Massilia sp. TWP1-3-3]|uniref:ribonuclease T2 family protein n=1 Tax=Massilia sp. TWP1-3-3 TaxID=2804573 RepID=UPI003CEABB9F
MTTSRQLLLITALCTAAAFAQAKPQRAAAPGQFDYYAVALSWSPSFCATHKDPGQCGRGLGFVLHGLWPQFEKGYPQKCSIEKLPTAVRESYAAIYPSPKLIGHEWDEHGTCSGLDPAAYFKLSSSLKDKLAIPKPYQQPAAPVRATPDEFVQLFRAANPGMPVDSVLPFCGDGGRFLREVHACFTREGAARTCSNGEIKRSYNSCRQESFLLQSTR